MPPHLPSGRAVHRGEDRAVRARSKNPRITDIYVVRQRYLLRQIGGRRVTHVDGRVMQEVCVWGGGGVGGTHENACHGHSYV